MADLPQAITKTAGQPSTVRVGTVIDSSPVRIDLAGTILDPAAVGMIGGYAPLEGDNVLLLGQSVEGADTSGSSWAALGGLRPIASTDWQTYTPVWTTLGVAPAVGNGSLTGRYVRLGGKTFATYIRLVAGTTTTFGSSVWLFTLPFVSAQVDWAACAQYLDVGVKRWGGLAYLFSTTQISPITPENGDVTASAPFAWGNTDICNIFIVGEIA